MNLLLDTHILLWWLDDNALLPVNAREAIADTDNLIILSSPPIGVIRSRSFT
jgi:PIN domain nuclease of toxin-antitoxin system